jgi:hypothetical protein
MFRSLFVPLDGSELAERVLPVATELAHAASGRVILFRAAFTPLAVEVDYEWHQRLAVEAAQRYVETVARVVATRVPVEMGSRTARPLTRSFASPNRGAPTAS